MNAEWAKQWIGNFSAGLDTLLEMYADDARFEDVIFAHRENGKEGLRKFFASFGGPDAGENVFTCNAYSGSAESGAVEWTWRAKHASKFMGVDAKGKETTVQGVSILTFKNGKIASQRDFWDANAMYRQLGAIK